MTVSASIPAAVVSMALLAVLRKATEGSQALENNLVQTAASAGESLAAGVIFTIPALVMIGYWKTFDYLTVTMIAGLGGLLGVLFTIPLRRALIVPGELKFPEGVATAAVIESGSGDERGGLGPILWAALAGAVFKLGQAGFGIWTSTTEIARRLGNTVIYFGSDLSPALLAVGYIVRLNIAVLIFIGGFISWYVAIPIYHALYAPDYADMEAAAAAWTIWTSKIRYLGVGAMVVGGLWALVSLRKPLVDGIRSGIHAVRERQAGCDIPKTERDIPMNWVLWAMLASVVPLFLLYYFLTGSLLVAVPMAMVMLVAGFAIFGRSFVYGWSCGLVQ
jgi:putative OPT family oligopeptide transporter